MYLSPSNTKLTIAGLLARLQRVHQPDHKALAYALQTSYLELITHGSGMHPVPDIGLEIPKQVMSYIAT